MGLPPAYIRRPLSITVWLLLSVIVLSLSPLLTAGARMWSRTSGDERPRIAVRLLLAYFTRELTTLVACGALWLIAGAGVLIRSRPLRAWHWRLLGWFVGGLAGVTFDAVGVKVEEEPSGEADAALRADGPVLVFSRHAGPADTIILIDRLLTRFRRHPSVVFKDAITLDPSIDLIAHRLPHAVLDTDDGKECQVRIERTAKALGRRGALLLFPEGGNFSPERRQGALRSLRRRGHRRAAMRAEAMHHVLPPRPSGAFTALDAAPEAPVVFAAHTGLGLAAYPREIYRELPIGQTLYTRMWLVPRAEIPDGEEERTAWLSHWWRQIDQWIDAHGTEPRA